MEKEDEAFQLCKEVFTLILESQHIVYLLSRYLSILSDCGNFAYWFMPLVFDL